jgi:hypothetical protein
MYRSALYWRTRLLGSVNAVFDGLWLGLLSREDWARFDESFYDTRREPVGNKQFRYDEEEWNLTGLQPWEATAIEDHFPTGSRVLVTGAGGGREVLALLERGFDAVGYEPHPKLVAAGSELLERRGYPARLLVSDRDKFPVVTDVFDAVLVGWGSYTLIAGRVRRIEFLRAARACLPDDAPIMLSFFERTSGGSPRLATMSKVANAVRRMRGLEPVELGDALSPNLVHHFSRDEIASELDAAGFRIKLYESDPYPHAIATARPW